MSHAPRLYRAVWSAAAGGLCLLGAAVCWWTLGPGAVLSLAGVTGAAAAGTYWLLIQAPEYPHDEIRLPFLLKVIAAAAAISLGLVGLGHLVGMVGVGALALLLLVSPDLPTLLRELAHPRRARAEEFRAEEFRAGKVQTGKVQAGKVQAGAPHRPSAVGSMTTEQLCAAWGASFQAVCVAGDPARMAVLAALRRDYLDELQRRDPDGFDLWLALHAHPGDDPRPHLSLGR